MQVLGEYGTHQQLAGLNGGHLRRMKLGQSMLVSAARLDMTCMSLSLAAVERSKMEAWLGEWSGLD